MKIKTSHHIYLRTGLVGLLIFLRPLQHPMPIESHLEPASTIQTPGDAGWASGFFVNGTNEAYARAVVTDDHHVFIGGDFLTLGNTVANHIAMWDGSSWAPLGSGVNNDVFALAADGHGNLYASGWFTQAGGIDANHIARWDGQEWKALGSGLDGSVFSLYIDNAGNVYAGGDFNIAGGVPATNIAKWDGTQWFALGEGVSHNYPWEPVIDRPVEIPYVLLIDGDTIYLGGYNVWQIKNGGYDAVGGGVSTDVPKALVNALALDQEGRLLVGGNFTKAGLAAANNIARWDGKYWQNLGGGIEGGRVYAMFYDAGGKAFIGGNIYQAGGKVSSNLAEWIEPFYIWLPIVAH